MAWLTGWGRRKSQVISQQAGIGTDHKVLFKIYKTTGTDGNETIGSNIARKIYVGSNCRDDFGDIRFTQSDEETLEDYWMETYTSGTFALIWVEPSGNVTDGDVTLYVYYDKADATDASNGFNTFGASGELFDDFNDESYDTGKWFTGGGTPVESGGVLTVQGDKVDSQSTYASPRRWRSRIKQYTDTNTGQWGMHYPHTSESDKFLFQRDSVGFQLTTEKANSVKIVASSIGLTLDFVTYEVTWEETTPEIVFYQDDVLDQTFNDKIPTVDLYIKFTSATNNPQMDIDWIFLMRRTAEPDWGSTGTEETAPSEGGAGFSIVHILQGIGILK